jgi:ribonuclease HI
MDNAPQSWITQNVRGFPVKQRNRFNWMLSWKQHLLGAPVYYIFIQETHVGSVQEASDLQRTWNLLWGIAVDDRHLSFWSTTDNRRGGVAILLHPFKVQDCFHELTRFTSRHHISIQSNSIRLSNIYAPQEGDAQKRFYRDLHMLDPPPLNTICAGDFNCTVDPSWDRCTKGVRSRQPGNPELTRLMEYWGLVDSLSIIQLEQTIEWNEYRRHYHTYGTFENSSRLDRFYLSPTLLPHIRRQRAFHPAVSTDHKGYGIRWEIPRSHRPQPLRYRPDELDDETRRALQEHISQLCIDEAHVDLDTMVQYLQATLEHELKQAKKRKKRSNNRRARRQARYEGVEPAVIKQRAQKLKAKQRQLRWKRVHRDTCHSTEFYTRVSPDRTRVNIDCITTTAGSPLPSAGPKTSLADAMALGWQSIMNPAPREVSAYLDFDLPSSLLLSDDDNAQLLRPISIDELHRSLSRMKRRKAGGIDGLTNDFILDHSALLEQWMLVQFNHFMRTQKLPIAFSTAKIITLYKSGERSEALNYRPIALLPSFYKLFTRVIATRISPLLISRIHPSQHGFVPDRQMEDALHTMQALLLQQSSDTTLCRDDSPVVVSIDYAKAYDSLQREYLYKTLQKWRFGQPFINLIEALHTNTMVMFEVNGLLSRKMPMTCGIRQGCPLAPLLFIIGMDPFARLIEQAPGLEGLSITDGPECYEVRTIGYVDDTVLVLKRASMLHQANQILEHFASASGLKIQPHKCKGIWINLAQRIDRFAGYPFQKSDESFRYLGIYLTDQQHMDKVNWTTRARMIKVRLGIASQRTNIPTNRAILLNNLAMPQLLYTAGFCTLPTDQQRRLEQLFREFLWTGQLNGSSRTRSKVHRQILALPRSKGGWGVQDIAQAVRIQAARKVARWALLPPGVARAAASTLLYPKRGQSRHSTPCLSPDTTSSGTTLWSKGRAVLERLLASQCKRTQLDITLTSQILSAPSLRISWRTATSGWLEVPEHAGLWTTLVRERWAVDDPVARFYWYFRSHHNPWITDKSQQVLAKTKWTQDPSISWVAVQQISMHRFEIRWKAQVPNTHSQWTSRDRWIATLIINARGWRPHATYPDNTALQLVHGPNYHWIRDGIATVTNGLDRVTLHSLNSTLVIPASSKGPQHQYVNFQQHPFVTKGFGPEVAAYKYSWRYLHYRRVQRIWRLWRKPLQDWAPGLNRLQHLQSQWDRRDALVGEALRHQAWSSIWRATEYDARIQQESYLWRLGAFNVFTPQGIPVCSLCHAREDLFHIMWNCLRAKQVWRMVLRFWGCNLRAQSLEHFKPAMLAAQPPSSYTKLHTLLLDRHTPARVFAAMDDYWIMLCQLGRRVLWQSRNHRVWDDQRDSAPQLQVVFTRLAHEELCFKIEASRVALSPVLQDIASSLTTTSELPKPAPTATGSYRLFFDGGSRTQSGLAGAGALLLRHTENGWAVVWAGAFPLPPSTNNVTEYCALLSGLQTASTLGWKHLTIIGDSQVILRQLQGRYRVRAARLRKLYYETRVQLANLDTFECLHTMRSHNTAADALANVAMDQGCALTFLGDDGTAQDDNHPPWFPDQFMSYVRHDSSFTATNHDDRPLG